MANAVSGKVIFNDLSASRAVRRFVEKQVARWTGAQGRAPSYVVQFRREGQGHTVSCEVLVDAGSKQWVAFEYESGPYQALMRCLAHLSSMNRPALVPAVAT